MEAKTRSIMPSPDVVQLSEVAANRLLLFAAEVRAGFPSPAADYEAEPIDLNSYLTQNPTSTFLAKVEGDSMIGAHIEPGDLVVVDRSVQHSSGRIVLAFIAGEFTIKRLILKPDAAYLVPENPKYKSIRVSQADMGSIWGVVVGVVKKV